jgi:hypothetical protein
MEFFFNNSTGAYRIALGKELIGIQVQRITANGFKVIPIPVFFAPKLHWYVSRYASLPNDYQVKTSLPRITFSMDGISPAPDRQLNVLSRLEAPPELVTSVKKWSLQATPYDFRFGVSIWAKNSGDVIQILEQLLQRFNPTINLHIKEVPVFGAWRTCRVKLDEVSTAVTSEWDIKGDRVIKYDIGMTLEGQIYPAVREQNLIQYITMNINLVSADFDTISAEVEEIEVPVNE